MNMTWLRKISICLFWLVIWQCISLLIDNSIIFAGPFEVIHALVFQLPTRGFWSTILYSVEKIGLGFLCGFSCGLIFGSLSFRFSFIRELLEPVMILLRSIPVVSFVILALIWTGSEHLSVLIAFLVVLPMIYVNTMAGLASADPKLLEMASVFQVPGFRRIRSIYIPALVPYLLSGCRIALGMSWKSGIAAEVIGVPAGSMGEQLYISKIYLNTADLFAWTVVIIGISALTEQLFMWLLRTLARKGGFYDR